MANNQTSIDHEGRISVLENKLEDFISFSKENFTEIKFDIKESKKNYQKIELQLAEFGNGGFREIIIETNEKLMKEILEHDDKERDYQLNKDKSKFKYLIDKYKIVLSIIGTGAGLKIIDLVGELLSK